MLQEQGETTMPVIRISEETMERLKAWAKPLEDTAESAFAKVLDVAERHRDTSGTLAAGRRPRQRRRARDRLSQKELRAGEPESFIDHLLAMPDAGEDADFDCLRSDSRRIEI